MGAWHQDSIAYRAMFNGWQKKGCQGQCLTSFPYTVGFFQAKWKLSLLQTHIATAHLSGSTIDYQETIFSPLVLWESTMGQMNFSPPKWWFDFGPVPSDFSGNCEARVGQSNSLGLCQPPLKLWILSQVSSSWRHREASEFQVSGLAPGGSDSRLALHWILWGYEG